MSVRIIMISNGDKIIGDFRKFDVSGNNMFIENNRVTIDKPFVLKEVMTQEGFTIIPLPLVTSNNNEVEINVDHIVVFPCTPTEEIQDMYTQMTSNLVLPKTKSEIKLV